ncbi:remorin-like protein, partial [Genlisea aurea]
SRAFLSPGTPNYRYSSGLFQKGWSSEHVSIYSHMMNNRRNPNSAAAAAALFSGKALPSKWEDAERWIFSPVSGSDSLIRNSFQRRPKSKSGPLGPPGSTLNQMFSPAVHIFENVDNCGKVLAADSPFSAA